MTSDPLRCLQTAVHRMAAMVDSGCRVRRVLLIGSDGKKILEVLVPLGMPHLGTEEETQESIPLSGWRSDRN